MQKIIFNILEDYCDHLKRKDESSLFDKNSKLAINSSVKYKEREYFIRSTVLLTPTVSSSHKIAYDIYTV